MTVSGARLYIRTDNLVLAILDGLAPEDVVELMAAGALVRPLPYDIEHFLLDLHTLIANSRVVEGTENVVDDFVDGDARMFPSIENAAACYKLVGFVASGALFKVTYGTVY